MEEESSAPKSESRPLDVALSQGDKEWVADGKRTRCVSCRSEFGLMTRKHHCRGCGDVFCGPCSSDNYEFRTGPARVCFYCYAKRATLTSLDNQAIDTYICPQLEWTPQWKGLVERRRRDKQNFRERKILLVGDYGIVFVKQGDTREKYTFSLRQHLMDLSGILVKRGKVYLEFRDHFGNGTTCFLYFICADSQTLVKALLEAKRKITIGFPHKVLVQMKDDELPLDDFKEGPVGGLIDTYKAYCHYYSVPVKEELITYVLDLSSNDIHEIDLTSCPGIDKTDVERVRVDLRPLLSALAHNSYFNSVLLDEVQEDSVISSLGVAMLSNSSITKISISDAKNGGAGMALQALGEAFAVNPYNALQVLNLSGVNVGFRHAHERLFTGLSQLSHGLRCLVLRECSLQPNHFDRLFKAFRHYSMSLTIEMLDLSHNEMGQGGSAAFGDWVQDVAHPVNHSSLKTLLLRNCNLVWEKVARFQKLLSLEVLDISGNPLIGPEVPLMAQTVEQLVNLKTLRLEHCQLTAYTANQMFDTIIRVNEKITELRLDLGRQSLVPSAGVDLFMKTPFTASNIRSISLSACKLHPDHFIKVMRNLTSVICLRTLILDNAIDSHGGQSLSQGTAVEIAETIGLLLQAVNSISVLSMARQFPPNVICCLLHQVQQGKSSLEELDVSYNNNEMIVHDLGIFLRFNQSLRRAGIDRNHITLQGLLSLKASLEYNTTLQEMEIPWEDYKHLENSKSRKIEPIRNLLMDIQEKLWLNRRRASKLYVSELLHLDNFTEIDAPTEVMPLAPIPQHLLGKAISLETTNASFVQEPSRTLSPQSKREEQLITPALSASVDSLRPSSTITTTTTTTTSISSTTPKLYPEAEEFQAGGPVSKQSAPPPPPEVAASAPISSSSSSSFKPGNRSVLLESIEMFKKDALKSTETRDKTRSAFMHEGGDGSAEQGSLADLLAQAISGRRKAISKGGAAPDDDSDEEW